ncbi:MAG TPA: hypothetical protein ENK19_09395 [Acidobacteria bacterium]|nr:hypothetical protein [Acidobacteriota bacterium]
MRSFEVPEGDPEAFVERVREELAGTQLGDMVRIEMVAGQLVVQFTRLGRSELRYDIFEEQPGFRARLARERVALTHIPFRDAFDRNFERLIARVGGRVD